MLFAFLIWLASLFAGGEDPTYLNDCELDVRPPARDWDGYPHVPDWRPK